MKRCTSPDAIKSITFYTLIITHSIIIMLLTTGCEKEKIVSTNVPPPAIQPPAPPTNTNTAPTVNAGRNEYLAFPVDYFMLKGFASDSENNIVSYSWKRISGPASIVIENPASLATKVKVLEEGAYEFELIVTDSYGLQGRSSVKIFVMRVGQNEVIFKQLTWQCPMGCAVTVFNFYSFVPRDTAILVFLRKKNSTTWIPITKEDYLTASDKYLYEINSYNGNDYLLIYTSDEEGEVDVKVQY